MAIVKLPRQKISSPSVLYPRVLILRKIDEHNALVQHPQQHQIQECHNKHGEIPGKELNQGVNIIFICN